MCITPLLGASEEPSFAAPTPTLGAITPTVRPGFSIGYAPSPGSIERFTTTDASNRRRPTRAHTIVDRAS